jgi:hypothetical protein
MSVTPQETTAMRAFVVTIDTEANGWDQTLTNSIENIKYVRPLQDLFDRHGVRPTYLVSYEMATRDQAIEILKPIQDSDRCEIGHHLHVWSCPPFERPSPQGVDLAWLRGLQVELPDDLFYAKAETLRAAITTAYGRAPTSHRAGRWAIDLRTLRWLRDTGFLVDTSMTADVSWAHTKGVHGIYGVDTSKIPAAPFIQDLGEPFTPGRVASAGLLEVPVSSARLPQRGLARVAEAVNRLNLPGTRVVSRVFSRPFPAPFRILSCRVDPSFRRSDLRALAKVALAGTGVVNLMLHSSEVMPGGSPHSRTPAMHARVMRHLATLCRWAEENGLEPLTLSELARCLRARSNGSRQPSQEHGQPPGPGTGSPREGPRPGTRPEKRNLRPHPAGSPVGMETPP